jgi:hypothetical protein
MIEFRQAPQKWSGRFGMVRSVDALAILVLVLFRAFIWPSDWMWVVSLQRKEFGGTSSADVAIVWCNFLEILNVAGLHHVLVLE